MKRKLKILIEMLKIFINVLWLFPQFLILFSAVIVFYPIIALFISWSCLCEEFKYQHGPENESQWKWTISGFFNN